MKCETFWSRCTRIEAPWCRRRAAGRAGDSQQLVDIMPGASSRAGFERGERQGGNDAVGATHQGSGELGRRAR